MINEGRITAQRIKDLSSAQLAEETMSAPEVNFDSAELFLLEASPSIADLERSLTSKSTKSAIVTKEKLLKKTPDILRDFAEDAIDALHDEGLSYGAIAALQYRNFSPGHSELWISADQSIGISGSTRMALTVYRGAVTAHLDQNPWEDSSAPFFLPLS